MSPGPFDPNRRGAPKFGAEYRELLHKLRPAIRRKRAAVARELVRPPLTLCHGDAHLENIFFAEHFEGGCMFIDFGLTGFGQALSDVAMVVGAGMRPRGSRAAPALSVDGAPYAVAAPRPQIPPKPRAAGRRRRVESRPPRCDTQATRGAARARARPRHAPGWQEWHGQRVTLLASSAAGSLALCWPRPPQPGRLLPRSRSNR